MRRCQKLLLIVVLGLPSVALGQGLPSGAPTVRVSGLTGQSITLSEQDLDAMTRESVNVTDEKGHPAGYEGVPLIEVLRRAGVPSEKELHAKKMAVYVLVTASDGYRMVFALEELDPAFTDRHILLVDRRDGKELTVAEGPFRIVVPGDKRHARWVRNVTSLALKTTE